MKFYNAVPNEIQQIRFISFLGTSSWLVVASYVFNVINNCYEFCKVVDFIERIELI